MAAARQSSAGLDTNDLLKGIAAYYTIDGKLLSLPFNASAPMLYYNKTAFKEVGPRPREAVADASGSSRRR